MTEVLVLAIAEKEVSNPCSAMNIETQRKRQVANALV